MKTIIILILLLPLSAYSQTKGNKNFDTILCDSIRTTAMLDINSYIDQIVLCSGKDTLNITYCKEVILITFDSGDYFEFMSNSTEDGDNSEKKVTKLKTIPNAKWIVQTIDNENRVPYEMFDYFIYKCSMRYDKLPGWDAEYKIKVDNEGMRIIGRKISVILVSD